MAIDQRLDRYKWRVVAMLWGISFFNYADRAALFTLFPLLEREMHLSPVQLGLLGSSFAWMYGLLAPFSGNLVDRVSRKKAVLGGLYAWSLICSLHFPVARVSSTPRIHDGGRSGRKPLLPGFDVDAERLPWAGDAIARHGPASDQRLCRNHCGRFLRRIDR